LIDRLDALDRRAGFAPRSSVSWRERRPPYPVIAAGVLILLEATSLVRLATDELSGLAAVLLLPLSLLVFVATLIPLYSQRRWGLWTLIATQVPVVARVIQRSVGHPARATWFLYVVAVLGLLTLPSSSRRFYRGAWYTQSPSANKRGGSF